MDSETQQSLSVEDNEIIDFTSTIERLDARAKKARRRVTVIGALLIFSMSIVVWMLMSGIFKQTNVSLKLKKLSFSAQSEYNSDVFERRINQLMLELIGPDYRRDEFKPPNKERVLELRESLDEAMKDLERYKNISRIGKQAPVVTSSSELSSVIGSAVFSLGVVAFIVLIIQIAVTFMRYHTRLAELYEAQADALRASNGIPQRAYAFMEQFSPNSIELGKTPTTLYEKALDTVKEVAKK